jgi:hypothetical protein
MLSEEATPFYTGSRLWGTPFLFLNRPKDCQWILAVLYDILPYLSYLNSPQNTAFFPIYRV